MNSERLEFYKEPFPIPHGEAVHPLLMNGLPYVTTLLPLHGPEIRHLEKLFRSIKTPNSITHMNRVINEAENRAQKRLATVGMSTSEYYMAYNAFHIESGAIFVDRLVNQTEERLNLESVTPTTSLLTVDEVAKKHARIIEQLLEKVPVAGNKQKLIIVSGPFAGGKSETIHSKLDLEGVLEIDLDVLRGLLMNGYDPTNQKDIQRVRGESWILSDIILRTALETGRSVVIQTALHRESRWLNDPNLIFASENHIDMEIYTVLRPIADCLARNVRRSGRTVSLKDLVQSINGMAVLPKLIEKFQNTRKVTLMDYYPLVEARSGTNFFGKKMYNDLMTYAKAKKMHIEEQDVDIQIESQ